VAFSHDGKTIAAVCRRSNDGHDGVVLWDVTARRRLGDEPLFVREGDVLSAAFSPDGRFIAARYSDGVIRGDGALGGGVVLLDMDLESWQRRAGQIANRNFTRKEWRDYFPEERYHAIFPDLPVPPEATPSSTASPTVPNP
jgi:hypothetical protein